MNTGLATTVDRFGHTLPRLTLEETLERNALIKSEGDKVRNWTSPNVFFYSRKRLKQLVRGGVPQPLRRRVWLQLSKGSELREHHPVDYFASLARRTYAKAELLDIESAILRSMPGSALIAASNGLHSVRRVVLAYNLHTGQSNQQNTTCIAAFLISVVGIDQEEDCFWIMVGLLGTILPSSYTSEESGQGLSVEHFVLRELLKKRCPKLLSNLAVMDCSLAEVTSTWFSHLFCGVLPAETTVRVWDCLLSEGPKVIFRVALALLKREAAILAQNLHKLRNFQWRLCRTFNADSLLKVAFYGIGSLPTAVITQARQSVERTVIQEHEHHAKRLEALLCPSRLSPQPSTSSAGYDLPTIAEGPEPCPKDVGPDIVASFQMKLAPLKV